MMMEVQEITRRMISAMDDRPSSDELAQHATMVIWKVLVGHTIDSRALLDCVAGSVMRLVRNSDAPAFTSSAGIVGLSSCKMNKCAKFSVQTKKR